MTRKPKIALPVNEALREHVTSIGFALTLSKTQIYILSILHYGKGYRGCFRKGLLAPHSYGSRFYTPGVWSLHRKGLVQFVNEHLPGDDPNRDVTLTRAGHLTVQLLKESGIYQDTMLKAGVTQ